MRAYPHRRRVRLAIPVVWLAALVVVCWSGTTATAAVRSSNQQAKTKPKQHPVHKSTSLAGAWSGQYTGALTGTFTIHWTGPNSNLTGWITLSTPPGKYDISGGVNDRAISFGAVGAGATYKGSVSSNGKSMSGTWNSPIGSGSWSAQKTS
jgi:hypothetical protein